MKKIYKKISISNLQQDNNLNRNLHRILGGQQIGAGRCTCGCHYANSGGSSECDNSTANFGSGLHSPQGGWSCVDNTLTEQNRYLCTPTP